ncbi:chemotaxis protein CheB [Nocardia terpenica]|uniref:protein-glutamate methylesterase n=1 Tax=Nocardia terpenica TaxID=455432 RepID=A0A164KRU1_9NOCA|nr:chemotaxis protein CheB [Nocardia terpenica]KZM71662.1 chemotaxis protein [Nocardia terpenica]NQE90891.1 chemotaxis protein CheB [Nocardia terpenica]
MSGPRSPGRYDVLAVASSAGGIHALRTLLGALGPDLPVPVLVVQHLDRRHPTMLAEILARVTTLVVKLADDAEYAVAGTVYLAPPDRHLLVGPHGRLTLSTSERVHFSRPSADPLFESVAQVYKQHAIACVLTGTGSDGAVGVAAVKSQGGTTIAQDPRTAQRAGMPQAAVATGVVDLVLPLEEIGAVIRGLVQTRTDTWPIDTVPAVRAAS